MKLASLRDGSRDGQLAVVSRDLRSAHFATDIAPTLQRALDDWNFIAPQLQDLYDALNAGRARHPFDFSPRQCAAPLPRACQRIGSPARIDRVEPPAGSPADPLMYQGGSDDLLGPTDDIVCASEACGMDFEGGVAVITGDVPMGAGAAEAADAIRLVMLANDVALRHLMPGELALGCGLLHSRPATAFSPVAVTPDELGAAWRGGMVHLPLILTWNGKVVGRPHAGTDAAFSFPRLIAHLCRTRNCRAGSIIGASLVANRDGDAGYACIAEQRCREARDGGTATTEFMKFGDTIRIEMFDTSGASVFGAIDQAIAAPQPR